MLPDELKWVEGERNDQTRSDTDSSVILNMLSIAERGLIVEVLLEEFLDFPDQCLAGNHPDEIGEISLKECFGPLVLEYLPATVEAASVEPKEMALLKEEWHDLQSISDEVKGVVKGETGPNEAPGDQIVRKRPFFSIL